MYLKDRYLEERLKLYYGLSPKLREYRQQILAPRELETFVKLMKLSNLPEHSSIENRKFLDLGSGDQFLKNVIESKQAKYHPLDYDTVDFNTDQIPFGPSSFDIVFSLAVIEHLENTDHFLREVFRVLKPGGICYLSTPNFRFCYRTFFNDPTHVKPFTDKSIHKILQLYNFKNVATFPGARCKNDWFYKGKNRFSKCAYLPFREKRWYLPTFLCGRATSVIAIGQKPVSKSY